MTKNLIKNYYVQFESLKSLPQVEVNSNSTFIKDFFFLENFILCLPPENPRDIAFFPSILKRRQRWWVSLESGRVVEARKLRASLAHT